MILSVCESPDVLKVARIAKIIINFLRVIVPIVLLVTGSMTFLKATASGENKKAVSSLIRKIVASVAVIMVPTLVGITLRLVDQKEVYYPCIKNANKSAIQAAYKKEAELEIVNVKTTLVESTLYSAYSVVNSMYDGPEKDALLAQLESLKTEVAQANEERRKKYEEGTKPASGGDGGGGSATGSYSKVEAMDMEESKVVAMTKEQFFDFIGSMAQMVYKEVGGVLPSITIAQASLESGYGKHFIASTHNVYGLRGYPGNKPKVYTASGGNYLRKFDNFYEATYYHATYFFQYSNVYGNFLSLCNSRQPLAAASYLGAYAGGSPTYGSKIQQIISQYNLTKYDNF